MKHPKLFIALLLSVAIAANATDNSKQRRRNPERDFKNYIEAFKTNDIYITLPEGFTPISTRGIANVRETIGCGTIISSVDWRYATKNIGHVIEDDSCRVAICFPTLPSNDIRAILGGRGVEADLRMVHNDKDLDVRPMIKIIAEDDMSQYANADTAVIYEFEMLSRNFLNCYLEGVGIYLRKRNHPSLHLRLMFDFESIDDKEKYIRTVLDNIHFGNNPSEHYVELEKKVSGQSDFAFPTHYRTMTGILPDINDETLDEINRVKAWCEEHGIKELPRVDEEVLAALNQAKAYRDGKKAEADSILSADIPEDEKILSYPMFDSSPRFPGEDSFEEYKAWIEENMQYPVEAINEGASKSETILVCFTVCADGTIKDASVSEFNRNVNKRLQDEALRLVRSMPRWIPAQYKGMAVNAYTRCPVYMTYNPDKKPKQTPPTVTGQKGYTFDEHTHDMSSIPVPPKFKGGSDAIAAWISDHLQYPAEAAKAKIEGRVIVEFIIDKDGTVKEPQVLRGINDALNAEAIRVIKTLPRWTPGTSDGEPRPTRYRWPVTFRLAKAK